MDRSVYDLACARLGVVACYLDMKQICFECGLSYDKYRNHRSNKSRLKADELYTLLGYINKVIGSQVTDYRF